MFIYLFLVRYLYYIYTFETFEMKKSPQFFSVRYKNLERERERDMKSRESEGKKKSLCFLLLPTLFTPPPSSPSLYSTWLL